MISFVYQGKDKGSFNICEDSLTSTVFDLLKYLPSEILYRIIKKALYKDKLPETSGELLSISFWEKWDATNTTNSNFVEPDVFLRFQNLDIIIEAKRYDEFQQNNYQIEKEIIAYFNEYSEDNKEIYFIQLGGLYNKQDVTDYTYEGRVVRICKSNWTQLLNAVDNENNFYKNHHLSILRPYSRILEDCIKGFEIHQFYKKKWLVDMELTSLYSTLNSDLLDFKNAFSNLKFLQNLAALNINESLMKNEFSYAKC